MYQLLSLFKYCVIFLKNITIISAFLLFSYNTGFFFLIILFTSFWKLPSFSLSSIVSSEIIDIVNLWFNSFQNLNTPDEIFTL